MTHHLTLIAGGRTDRPPSPTRAADNETEVFTLPQHVIEQLEKQCSATASRRDQDQIRQADRPSDLTKSEKPAT